MWEAAAAGVGSALGGIWSAERNYDAVKATNSTNLQIANKNRAFQERMSNTAHQRERADMIAAGINPLLSVTGGSGASTPSGSTATMQAPQMDIAGVVNSALSAYRNALDNKLTKEQIANLQEATTARKIENQINATAIPQANKDAEVAKGWMGTVSAYAKPIGQVLGILKNGTSAYTNLKNSATSRQVADYRTDGVIPIRR